VLFKQENGQIKTQLHDKYKYYSVLIGLHNNYSTKTAPAASVTTTTTTTIYNLMIKK
jgi:hypothetical protein